MWKILVQKKGVGVYFNGHNHEDSIAHQKNWTFVQTSAVLDQRAFRVIEITDDAISVSSADVDTEELKKNATIIYENINHYTHQVDARGTEKNRQCLIPLIRDTVKI